MSTPGPLYPCLPAAVLQATVEATPSATSNDLVKSYLLNLTSELLAIQSTTTPLGTSSTDRYSSCLQTLRDRLQDGHRSPFAGLEFRIGQSVNRRDTTPNGTAVYSPMQMPLGEYEDLYYATLATVKAMYDHVIVRLNNSFNHPDEPLSSSSQYTVHEFQQWLVQQWGLLNEPSFVLALDVAVREAFAEDHLCQGLCSQVETGQITQVDANAARDQLFQSKVFMEMPGLSWVGNEHSGMINGRLNEKYRVVFRFKKQAREKKLRWEKKKDRIKKTASTSPQGTGRRGSGEHQRQLHQSIVHSAYQGTSTTAVVTEKETHGDEPWQEGSCEAQRPQEFDQSHGGSHFALQDKVEAWRLHSHQQIASERDDRKQPLESEVRRKISPTRGSLDDPRQHRSAHTLQSATQQPGYDNEQASTGLLGNLHSHMHPRNQPFQPSAAAQLPFSPTSQKMLFQAERDGWPRDQEHTVPGTTSREWRTQRVTEYQTWLRETASASARTLVGRSGPSQPDMRDASLQGSESTDVDDGGF